MRVLALAAAAATLTTVIAAPWTPFIGKKIEDGPVKTMDSWSWSDCGLPGDVVEIKSLTVSPDPPVPGQNLTIYATGTVTEKIEEGAYADVVVKLGLVKLLSKRFDVCEEAQVARNNDAEIQCPVEEGEHSIAQTVMLPKEIPKAKFVVQVRAFTEDDEPMLCADIRVDFMKRPF